MNFGPSPLSLGRYVVDINGCLRTTETSRLSPADIAGLHGGIAAGTLIVWENNGESIPLAPGDHVELDEGSVAFFRSCDTSRLFRTAFAGVTRRRPRPRSAIAA